MRLLKTNPREGDVTEFKDDKYDDENRSKKVCVVTNGCPENRVDGARMQEFLKDNGFTVTADYKDAEIIFFNSCALTEGTQEESMDIINLIQTQKRPSAELVVFGCLPKINRARLSEVYQGITFGSDEIEKVTEIAETRTSPQDTYANYLIPRISAPLLRRYRLRHLKKILSLKRLKEKFTDLRYHRLSSAIDVVSPHTFCIKVCTGCLSACAFCAVRLSRGKLRSKPIDDVVKEFEEGLARGKTEFALIGTETGAYGRDQGTTLCALLRELLKRKGDYEIRLRNIQPRYLIQMMPEFREILQGGKIRYFSSAVESGNNRILRLMRRGYEIEDYKQAVLTLKKEFPEIRIRTQILVGFPSETEDEFQDTLRLLDEVDFAFVEVYEFEPRPNTEAATMEGQVPEEVIRRRCYKARVAGLSASDFSANGA